MRKSGITLSILCLFLLYFLIPSALSVAGTGTIRARIVLPGTAATQGGILPLSIATQSRMPLDGGDGGGGDGGGGDDGSDDGGGDSGYDYSPWEPFTLTEEQVQKLVNEKILEVTNLTEGLHNLIIEYRRDMQDGSKANYELSLRNIRVVQDQVTDLKDVVMKKGGKISGSIKYAERTDFPMTTIHVVGFAGANRANLPAWLNDRTNTLTDLSGNFTLNNLPEGTYTLAITPGGDATATHSREIIPNVRVESEKATNATPFGPLTMTSTLGRLKGTATLYDKDPGAYGGIIIRVTSEAGSYRSYLQVTDVNGVFDFGNIPIATYALSIHHTGYRVIEKTGVSVTGSTSPAINEELLPGTKYICGRVMLPGAGGFRGDLNNDQRLDLSDAIVALRLAIGYPVSVGVSSDASGDGKINLSEAIYAVQALAGLRTYSSPLAGTLVLLPGTPLMAVTDGEGKFRVSGIPRNRIGAYDYDLFIMRDGFKALKAEATIAQTNCDFTALSLNLTPNEPVVAGSPVRKSSIVGRSLLKNIPDPSTIDVAIENTSFVAKPNGSGNFVFTNIPPGTYTLRYSNPGYKTVVEAAVLAVADHATEVRKVVMIPRNGTIKGRIKLESSSDWGNIPIRVEPIEGLPAGSTSFATDNSGFYTITLPENFDPVSNIPCVLDNRAAGTGRCLAPTVPAYTIRVGGGDWVQSEYQPHTFSTVNVPAGELIDLGEITLQKPPARPSGVAAAQASGSSVKITWTASTSADTVGYNIYYGTRSDQITTKANTTLVTIATGVQGDYVATGLSKGIKYYFAVEAVDQTNLSSSKVPGDGTCFWTVQPEYKGQVIGGGYIFSYPLDIALIVDGSKGYVSNRGAASLFVVDFSLAKPAVKSQIIIPGTSPTPTTLAFNATRNELYVVDYNQGKLFVVDTLNDTIDPVGVSVGTSPQNVLVSPDGSKIYVTAQGLDKIVIIDAATRQPEATILIGEDADPTGMTMAGQKLYVLGSWTKKVYIIDLDPQSANYRTVLSPPISVGGQPHAALAQPDGAYVYVSHDDPEGTISVINTATNAVSTITTQTQSATKGKSSRGMAISGNILYVVNNGDDTVTMINTQTNEKLDTSADVSSGGNGPETIAVSPDGSRLYIVHSSAGSVQILGY